MLNTGGGIKKTTGAGPNQILLFMEPKVSLGIVVSNATTVTVDGRKVVKAGTPLVGDLDARTTAFTVAKADGTDAASVKGVLLHDVDVTDGNANGSILVHGFVNTNRLDTATKAMITAGVKTALDAKVTFIAG